MGRCGAVTAIQRASSDLRLNSHFHTLFIDGVYIVDGDGGSPVFHPAPPPSQGVIAAVMAPASDAKGRCA
jgi:hypothetical protein